MSDKQRRPESNQEQSAEVEHEFIPSALGSQYTIVRGDTLSGIATRAYGAARYWRHLMDANPGKVRRGGDLIVVGDELTMPPVGGVFDVDFEPFTVAVVLEEVRTPYGNFLVLPVGYEGKPEPREGWTIVHEVEFEAVKQASKVASGT